MIQANNKTGIIKIFGIDKMVVVTDQPEIHQAIPDDAKILVKDYQSFTVFPTAAEILRETKFLLKALGLKRNRVILGSDRPEILKIFRRLEAAMVLGIRKKGEGIQDLYESGADHVCNSLSELELVDGADDQFFFTQHLPSAFQFVSGDSFPFNHERPVFFFDYDGTLAPIVNDPVKAKLKDSVRSLLDQLSEFYHVAVVSGRDLTSLRDFIQLDHLIYAGSHGFRIAGPGGLSWTHSEAEKILPKLDRMEEILREQFSVSEGFSIERKYSALAIHYRNAPRNSFKRINGFLKELLADYEGLKRVRGKKIIEIRPAFNWNKGKAVEWILRKLGCSYPDEYLPVYLGDDLTDEDAFRTLSGQGVGILVGNHGDFSAADLHLQGVDQVEQLLHILVQQSVLMKKKNLVSN
jgi:trehalose-phosphatase